MGRALTGERLSEKTTPHPPTAKGAAVHTRCSARTRAKKAAAWAVALAVAASARASRSRFKRSRAEVPIASFGAGVSGPRSAASQPRCVGPRDDRCASVKVDRLGRTNSVVRGRGGGEGRISEARALRNRRAARGRGGMAAPGRARAPLPGSPKAHALINPVAHQSISRPRHSPACARTRPG